MQYKSIGQICELTPKPPLVSTSRSYDVTLKFANATPTAVLYGCRELTKQASYVLCHRSSEFLPLH